MSRVFVLNTNKHPLMPCSQARARGLLRDGRAAVYRKYPFTIILKQELTAPSTQPVEVKYDPGSKTTGIALVGNFARGNEVLWAANLSHKSSSIRSNLESRRAIRRSRRARHTRYRAPRFLNRRRPTGWLPPSLMSRVFHIETWSRRLMLYTPASSFCIETTRFDTQKMINPEIQGVEYQRGELAGYEVREYLLEKFNRKCVYCGKENVPLEIDHVIPRSKGGTNKVTNLVLACHTCNQKKSNKSLDEFVKDKSKLTTIKSRMHATLKDAAAMNATRYRVGDMVKSYGLPTSFHSGAYTKMNRLKGGYPKDHWIDAACVGVTGESVVIPSHIKPLAIRSMMKGCIGRGARQCCSVDKFGFPKSKPKRHKEIFGFRTGDIVVINKPKIPSFVGRVTVAASGGFAATPTRHVGKPISVNHKYCTKILHRFDGYGYA